MGEYDARVLIEGGDTPLKQVTGIEVIAGRPLEQLAPGLIRHKVVVRREPHISGLPKVSNSGVLPRIAPANVRSPVDRRVVGDNELEILIALAKEGLDGLRHIRLTVENGEPDGQPWWPVHRHVPSRRAARGSDVQSTSRRSVIISPGRERPAGATTRLPRSDYGSQSPADLIHAPRCITAASSVFRCTAANAAGGGPIELVTAPRPSLWGEPAREHLRHGVPGALSRSLADNRRGPRTLGTAQGWPGLGPAIP